MDYVWLRELCAVHIDLLIYNADAVARNADYALYIVRMIVVRKFEDDDVAVTNRPVGKQLFVPGAVAFKYEFVHEEMVADQQSRLHGFRGNFESLNDECGAKQGEQNRDEQRFGNVGQSAPCRFASHGSGNVRGNGDWVRG